MEYIPESAVQETRVGAPLWNNFLPEREPYWSLAAQEAGAGYKGGRHLSLRRYVPLGAVVGGCVGVAHRFRVGRSGRVIVDRFLCPPHSSGGDETDGGDTDDGYLRVDAKPFHPSPAVSTLCELGGEEKAWEGVREIGQSWEDEEEEDLVLLGEWVGEDLEVWGKERGVFGPI